MTPTEFVCPATRQPLYAAGDVLVTMDGRRYPIRDGVPELIAEEQRAAVQTAHGQDYYRARARDYDAGMEILFRTFHADEAAVRARMLEWFAVSNVDRVLETGCGTGRDSVGLAALCRRLYATDVSREMVDVCRQRLADAGTDGERVTLCVSDAAALPFADRFFDAAYHFGGINEFPDIRRSLAEMTRVVRPGGRVLVGDEGMAPWLFDTDFARILINTKSLHRHQPPLALLPIDARDVELHWILGGAFYVIAFTVGEGEPALDIDVEFPGPRGGSHRTRYYGKLEGVDPRLRQQVVEAAARDGVSVVAWLERMLEDALTRR